MLNRASPSPDPAETDRAQRSPRVLQARGHSVDGQEEQALGAGALIWPAAASQGSQCAQLQVGEGVHVWVTELDRP